jgi:hypothetical protein
MHRTFHRMPRRPGVHRIALALAVAMGAAPLRAPAAAAQQGAAWEVGTDNDAYDFWVPPSRRPDHDYTHGMWIAADLGRAPLWGRRLGGGLLACTGRERASQACLSTRVELGQKLYTPRVDAYDPVPGERAFAGWLYLSAAGSREGERSRTTGTLEVGTTGPESLGSTVYQEFHRIAGFWKPQGWHNQLAFEPAFSARLTREVLLVDAAHGDSRTATVASYASVAAGNLRTDAEAGVHARVGRALPHPWRRAAPTAADPRLSVYAMVGARADWVLHDLFLDGNTFHQSVRADRTPLVGQLEGGFGLRWKRFGAEYRVTTRSRDYRTQFASHTWSTIDLTLDHVK